MMIMMTAAASDPAWATMATARSRGGGRRWRLAGAWAASSPAVAGPAAAREDGPACESLPAPAA